MITSRAESKSESLSGSENKIGRVGKLAQTYACTAPATSLHFISYAVQIYRMHMCLCQPTCAPTDYKMEDNIVQPRKKLHILTILMFLGKSKVNTLYHHKSCCSSVVMPTLKFLREAAGSLSHSTVTETFYESSSDYSMLECKSVSRVPKHIATAYTPSVETYISTLVTM